MTAKTLSGFILQDIDLILEQWEQFAREIPSARLMDAQALRDHAAGILKAISADMGRTQTLYQQAEKSKGHAPEAVAETEAEMHGAHRVLSGFSVDDTMSEFRALRATVLRLWRDANPTLPQAASDELTRFNEAIDQALGESLARYANDKEHYTRLFDALLSSSPDLNYIYDLDGRFMYANQALFGLYGTTLAEIVGKSLFDLGAPSAPQVAQHMRQAIESRATLRVEMPYTLACGKEVIHEFLFIPVFDENGCVEAVAGTARDVTERRALEDKIRRSANYDSLTELPNRNLFRDRLELELRRAARTGLPIALLFIDLDGFKEVNDRLGHAAGDQLLQQAARRIGTCVRGSDTVARLGGDEFTVIFSEVTQLAHVEILAQAILEALALPFAIQQKEAHISGSIGITLFPQDAATSEELLRNADQAMYVAKNAGRNRFSFFTGTMRDAAWARLKVIEELRRALPEHQLAVYYQPIVELASGAIVKAEALLRWHHPGTGLMRTREFIGLGVETGLISEIGAWVLDQALGRAREWSALLGAPFQVHVNKSAVEFMSKSALKNWAADLAALGLAGRSVVVEITEDVLLNNAPWVRDKLEALRRAGVQLAVDDFGTAYAALAYLKKFAVDYLKIDPSFVQDAPGGANRNFAETIIVMAHRLGLKVIAEGVESAEQSAWLTAAGCDYAQGYLYSEPVARTQFSTLLKRSKRRNQAH